MKATGLWSLPVTAAVMGPQELAGSPEPARARGVVPRDRQSSHGTSARRIPKPPFLRARVPTESPQTRVRKGDPHKNPTDKTALCGTIRHGC
jgi:hypothetical protein